MTESKQPQKQTPARRTSPPRPDQLSEETMEFLTALDLYKRKEMRSFLRFEEVFPVLEAMGYSCSTKRKQMDASFDEALDLLREESGRLFPSWSEVYSVAIELGWTR